MSQQSIRQAARRAALDAQARHRRERAERDKRIEALAVDVLAALEERAASVADCERRAGLALRRLTQDEGLSIRESVEWCGATLTSREATRLVHAAQDEATVAEQAPPDSTTSANSATPDDQVL